MNPAKARALLEAATPGPWRASHSGRCDGDGPPEWDGGFTLEMPVCPDDPNDTYRVVSHIGGSGWGGEEADLMAAAPDLARAYLAAEERCDALRADLAWHEEHHGTRAAREAEEVESAALWERIEAMSDEELDAVLVEEGGDPGAIAERGRSGARWAIEHAMRYHDLRRERDELRRALARADADTAGLAEVVATLRRRVAYLQAALEAADKAAGGYVP